MSEPSSKESNSTEEMDKNSEIKNKNIKILQNIVRKLSINQLKLEFSKKLSEAEIRRLPYCWTCKTEKA
jgi:hypothetical protein